MSLNAADFDELISSTKNSAVHLEMRDAYGVAEENSDFAAWKAGDNSSRYDRMGRRREWLDLVERTVGRGVVMRRARIVSEPVSDYIRFEYEGAQLNVDAGELVRWLPRRRASDIALPGNDFWLFDERVVRFGHFSGNGAYVGEDFTDDPVVAKLCATAFETVWERAVPHAEYRV
ncbi:DUF6879 family protein [Streptomyces caatingaensis]|uniref:DUF6879 domain-containing protein n=1 Tax=Streptomyces caatingaensis TaxID=1678637 RepID=A0A0K9XG97_9ACTN|nr:DUF6879 family protein [Streptomyces caatingaensis]KNB51682.1 hypothetical protein AC230_15200 [Streptomyces caatingaensis]